MNRPQSVVTVRKAVTVRRTAGNAHGGQLLPGGSASGLPGPSFAPACSVKEGFDSIDSPVCRTAPAMRYGRCLVANRWLLHAGD